MHQIDLINKLLSQYKLWTIKLCSAGVNIENNILQKDESDPIEQKVLSIGIASLFVWIGTGLIGLFGVATGGFILGIVLFIIGWILSRVINKVIFGSPRKLENISSSEKELLNTLKEIENRHILIRDNINNKLTIVNFKDYILLRQEFENALNELNNFNAIHLALKYKLKHKYVTSKYKIEVKKFHKIYANK